MAEQTQRYPPWFLIDESIPFKPSNPLNNSNVITSCLLGEYVCIIFWIITTKAVPTKTVPTKQYQHYNNSHMI